MRQREIDCITRLFTLSPCLDDMLEFMLAEKICDPSELPYIKREVDRPKYIYKLLETAQKNEILQMLDFEWSLLPVERIKITMVTTRASKEFSYGQ